MHILSQRLRRFRNIVAAEVLNLAYTGKANVVSSNALFIHIPHNAGEAISSAFGLSSSDHYTARELNWWMGKRCYERFFTFCFVRNPYDRFLSLYRNARSPREESEHSAADYELLRNADLETCAELLLLGKLSRQWHPQTSWFLNDTGEIIVDYIGRYETLNEDLAFVSQRICGEYLLMPDRHTAGNDKAYRRILPDSVTDALSRYYMQDMAMLGYTF
ncbi:sulfotransferase family protein [Desulfovibrio subterraneus]|uniref:Sulfotransferase family protein n=1 Tax=Desulfovibrio subterraneus TaxID=2718620 RepID=A0A7J0BL71_9BACT|nr:sulfotransferase family 2 domain-containing protein [Desulfovibrio subterraneus]WBF68453.1 sulfotransferase family protein [Desulfovibrio subterraneus]GFM34410.1 hypothetical protein DSM101010T_27750 [Desulfovibrio subterraneus]